MIEKLYKYTGGVESFSYRRNSPGAVPVVDMILGDIDDDDKAPIRITAIGGLADYISAIEWTDAEERYIAANWYFDRLLCLHRIEVPSTEPGKPAKIIAQHGATDREASVFGPSEYIETSKPEPMDDEQSRAWYAFCAEDKYRY
mgnify:CR=1 FL=1